MMSFWHEGIKVDMGEIIAIWKEPAQNAHMTTGV